MSDSTARLTLDIPTAGAQANVAGLTTKLKDVAGAAAEATEQHKNFIEAMKDASEQLEGVGKTITTVGGPFLILTESLKRLGEGFEKLGELAKFSGEMKTLEANIPVQTLERMQRATEGTIDKVKLMQFGMKALNGEMGLTTRGLETVLTAAQHLHDKGFGDTIEIAEKLEQVLISGRTKGLHEFNIALVDTENKAQNARKALESLHQINAEETLVDPGLKAIERLEAATKNWIDHFKAGLGSVFTWFAQTVMGWADKLDAQRSEQSNAGAVNAHRYTPEQAAARTFRALYGHGFNPDDPDRFDIATMQREAVTMNALILQAQHQQQEDDNLRAIDSARGLMGMALMQNATIWAQTHGPEMKKHPGSKEAHGADIYGFFGVGGIRDIAMNPWEWAVEGEKAKETRTEGFFGEGGLIDQAFGPSEWAILGAKGNDDRTGGFFGEGGLIESAMLPGERGAAQREGFDKQLEDRSTAVGGAYSTMSSALAASVEAAITGGDNIGKAAMKASATALKSIAIEAGAKALFATAEGIFGFNPQGFAAAGMYAATVAAAGAGAALLGAAIGSGGASPSGSGYAPPTASPSGLVGSMPQQQGGPQSVTINISGLISAGDYAKVGEAVQKALQTANQAGRTSSDQNVTVRFF